VFAQIFSITAPVFLCAGIGMAWAKKGIPYETAFVTRLVTIVGVPCLIFSTLVKANITPDELATMGFASLASVVIFAAIAVPALRFFKLKQRTYLPAILFANTGNMALPLCLFAFGEQGLALGIAYFAVSALLLFVLGPAIAAGASNPKGILKMPLVWALLAALLAKFSGVTIFPWLFKTIDLLGNMAIPLMIITLGVSVSRLEIISLNRSIGLSVFRLTMGLIFGFGLAAMLGYEDAARGVLIIQCSMPVAVFNYLFAQAHGNNPEEVAGTVLVSTGLSFLTLPALLWFGTSI